MNIAGACRPTVDSEASFSDSTNESQGPFRISVLLIATVALLLSEAHALARTWKDKTGKFSIDAEFVKVNEGKVELKKDSGQVIAVPLDRLSDTDQKFVAAQLERQYVRFPNAGVKLLQPDGFFEVENFEGFHQDTTQSSIVVLKIPSSYQEIVAGFSADRLKQGGMTLRGKEEVKFQEHAGTLFNVSQSADGTDYAKWILVFGGQKEVKLITAMCPTAHQAKLFALLKSAVLSARTAD